MTTAVALFRKPLLDALPDGPVVATLIPEQDRYWRQNPADSVLKFPTAVAFSSKNSLLFICDKKKLTVFMANLHNPVCAIPIAGPKTGICSPQGILIKDNHLVALVGGNTSGLKIIDVKELLNKSRALLQLETNDIDVQPEAESSIRTSPSGKVKVHDVCLWSTTGMAKVGRLVSVATSPNSENEPFGINITILALSFDKKTIYKISQFDFDIQQKRYNAQLEILFVVSQGQPLCIYDAPEGLLISILNQEIKRIHHENASFGLTNVVERNPSVILGVTRTEEKLVFSDCHNHSVNFFSEGKISHALGGNHGMQDGFTVRFQSPSALVSYGESVFVCGTSNQAIRLISSLVAYTTEDIMDLLNLCLTSTYFQYNGKHYKQLHGTAMGSPVSVVVAEIVMQHVEERALATCRQTIPLWLRYVDDTFTAVHKDEIDDFHDHLNEQNADIQFTKEIEENGKLPFLDCLVSRDNNELRTTVYRKPTHTDRLLDQSSYNPTSHKATTIKTLTRRAQLVCDTPDSLRDENRYLERVFHKNNYNADFIRRNIYRPTEADATNRNPTPVTTVTIPYIKGTSETISRILQPYNIRVAHKPTITLRQLLTNVKDKDEPNNRQGAVYKIKCSDCQASYIGETGRNLNTRLTEHKRATKNGDANNHIAVHHQLTNHNIDWDSAQCLTYSTNYFQRLTLESWYTNLEQTPLNRCQQLPAPYKRLIHDGNETDKRTSNGPT